jgi:hypothetical protein
VSLTINAHGHLFDQREEDGLTFVAADSADHRNYLLVTVLPGGAFEIERVFF